VKKTKISLNTMDKVNKFLDVASELECDLDLISGRTVIDGKSMMGIFSLDLTKPIEMNIISQNDTDYILRAFKDFIIME
jgi:phosphotransferase system HPr-like phosphotransfer protein